MATSARTVRLGRFHIRKGWLIVFIILGLLIILRLFLPAIVLHFANRTLANMPGYYGHIDDIDISLYRGGYQVKSIYLDKKDSASGERTDFFKASLIDLSVEWRALLKGSLVGELEVTKPSVIFTKNKTELSDLKKDTSDFRKVLKGLMPLKINRFEIIDGDAHYVDRTVKPVVDIALKNIDILATNLNNSYDSSTLLPASVKASAQAYEGNLDIDMRLNALAEDATFDLNAELKNTNLVLLNDFLQAYADFDVNKGNFGLYTEMAAKEGNFKGYVKPVIKDLDVVGKEDRKDPFLRKLWESLVGAAGRVFRNPKKDQVATRVELEGSFKDPKTNTLDAIWEVLRNAFIQALIPSVDHEINIASVGKEEKKDDRNLFQRIFNSGKKDRKKEKKK